MVNNNSDQKELFTGRLQLRKLNLDDAPEIFSLRTDENVNRYLSRKVPASIEDVKEFISFINSGIKEGKSYYWAINIKGQKKLIGTICIWNIIKEKSKGEIGYELTPGCQGKGYMHEALTIVIDHAFNHLKLTTLEAVFHKDNLNSAKLLEKHFFHLNTNEEDQVEGMVVYGLNYQA